MILVKNFHPHNSNADDDDDADYVLGEEVSGGRRWRDRSGDLE